MKIEEELERLSEETLVEFRGIQQLVIACLVQKRFESLIHVAEICSKYMYGLDYFVDMLIKNSDYIPAGQRDAIADYFAQLSINAEFYSFEWHQASVAKLLGHEQYFRKTALIEIFRSPSKDTPTYPAVIALDGLVDQLTRSEFRTMREWFDRCDDWEKRRLLWLSRALPLEERKAWAKAVKPSIRNDYLGEAYAKELAKGNDIP